MMRRFGFTGIALAAALAAGAAIGHRWWGGIPPQSRGMRVASFRGGALDAAAVQAALATEPAALLSRDTRVALRVVDDLVRSRLLAALAVEKGYDKDPELLQRQAEQLAALYLEKEFETPQRAKVPSDEEVRAYLEAHRPELARPERVRVAVISFPAATPADRTAKRTKAQAALAEARRREGDYYAFGELARKQSEDPRTAARNGELPFMTRDELAAATAPEVSGAAFAMRDTGKVHPSIIEAGSGLFVLKLLGREAAQEPRYEELRDTLRARLASERRAADRKAFLDAAWKRAEVRVDEAALERILAEARAGRH